ncbi:MAG: hypothetical protein H7246_06750 [Phycisphaerae bacterium]|nr:hypothetical protein [Saprospiraceae bacterium]
MAALLRLLFMVLMLGLFITGVFYFIANIFSSIAFNPESRAWKEMLAKLRARLKKRNELRATGMPDPLVPCNAETLSHLSLKPKMLKKTGWRDPVFEGVISTIYQEPVLLFAGQKSGKTAVIVAQSNDKEFIFRQKGKETEVWQDGQPYAVFINGALLSSGKQSRMLAKLEADSELRQWPVLMGQGEAAMLTNVDRAVSPIPRALTLLRGLEPEEQQALLVLVVMQALQP